MRMTWLNSRSFVALALVAGCNGTDSGANGSGSTDGTGGKASEEEEAGPSAIEVRRAALELGTDRVHIDEAMERIDELIYEDAWEAEDENRIADTVDPLLTAEHLFRVCEPEKEAHASDAKFQKWMAQAAQYCADGAEAALAEDRAALKAAFEKIDQSCASCHKVYRKKKK